MAGGRSKGCLTCRARKVACDKTRPTCGRCAQAGLECRGYDASLIIIDERPRLMRIQRRAEIQQKQFQQLGGRLDSAKHTAHPSVPHELSLRAFDEKIYVSFLISKLFSHRPREQVHCFWMDYKRFHAVTAKTAYQSLLALATVFYGRAHGQAEIVKKGTRIYSDALPSLRADLADPVIAFNFETIASTTTLSMFELLVGASEDGWIHHAGGLARLIEARGPSRHKSYPEKGAFLQHRVLIIAKAIITRKRTFLEDEAWKTAPWEEDGGFKSRCDLLNDIMCDIPHLMEDVDILSSKKSPGSYNGQIDVEAANLRTRILASVITLNKWWREWLEERSYNCVEIPVDMTTPNTADMDGPLFSHILMFSDFWTAFEVCGHNTARILLLQMLRSIPDSSSHWRTLGALLDETNISPLLGISSDITGLAHEILRCMDFCQAEQHKATGTFCVLLPTRVAYQSLNKDSREARWLWRRSADQLINLNGFEIGREILRNLPGSPV